LLKQELNVIDHVVIEAKHSAEKKCQKFKCGQVQWSPQVKVAINKILFWKSILKRETGGKVGLTAVLATRAKKAHIDQIPYPGEFSMPTLQEKIGKAYKQFGQLKKDDTWRDTWIAQLIAAQALAWNRTKKALRKQLHSTKRICKMATNVQRTLNKEVIHKPLSMVTAPSPSLAHQEYHQKVELEKACLAEAGHHFTRHRRLHSYPHH